MIIFYNDTRIDLYSEDENEDFKDRVEEYLMNAKKTIYNYQKTLESIRYLYTV